MPRTCKRCNRVNPNEAAYCFHDGHLLEGKAGAVDVAVDVGARPFGVPFVFPSGRSCNNFNELALACNEDAAATLAVLKKGYLTSFFASQGRADLAEAANAVNRAPDRKRGLDDFLGCLPGTVLKPAKLRVDPLVIDVGVMRPGEDDACEVVLANEGLRLLSGSASCDGVLWLSLGDGPAQRRKVLQISNRATLAIHVLGRQLRAFNKPHEAEILIESNGGVATVVVRVQVPVLPFPEGVLAGQTPRQMAQKAHAAAKAAVPLIESGAVARWYESNGWTYPVQGPTASGLAAVQQLFEALGMASPPRLELAEAAVHLRGGPGETVEHILSVVTQENKAVIAHGSSDQEWLRIGPTVFRGRTAEVPLSVPAVPGRPGDVHQASVTIIGNGGQRFVAPVTLVVAGPAAKAVVPPPASRTPRPVVAPLPPAKAVQPTPAPRMEVPKRRPMWVNLVPAVLLVGALLGVAARDYSAPTGTGPERPIEEIEAAQRIDIRFHDAKINDELEKVYLPDGEPTMRFGLVMLRKGKEIGKGAGLKRLTFDPWGRTNNVCLRLDKNDFRLFGVSRGRWEERGAKSWQDEQGKEHSGMKSVWRLDDKKILVTQFVELVRGEQSNALDTCRVRYRIENKDDKEQPVGIRFMLDSFIGGNDGVPFTIPGESELCDTRMDLPGPAKNKKKIPDFLQALEKPDLAHPGTIAHLRLKLEKLEPPSRVTLGAWPNEKLGVQSRNALGLATLYNVPVLPMKALGLNDSAIVIYWNQQPLAAGAKREVGFEYGLWSLARQGNQLAATVDGSFRPDGELTVVAYVNNPGLADKDESATLTLPEGFKLMEGTERQEIPKLAAGAKSGNRPVTWKVRAGPTGKYKLTVATSSGASQDLPIQIKSAIFD